MFPVSFAISHLWRAASLILIAVSCSGICWAQTQPKVPDENWAEELLKQDSLTNRSSITLEDLLTALDDPQRRETVIERHFTRAQLDQSAQKLFFKKALAVESDSVRRQAIAKMLELGLLEHVIAEIVLERAEKGDEERRLEALVILQDFDWGQMLAPSWYRELVRQSLTSGDPLRRDAAAKQLAAWPAEELPELLKQLNSEDTDRRREATLVLSKILSIKRTPAQKLATKQAIISTEQSPVVVAKFRNTVTVGPLTERVQEDQDAKSVRVYFGTNRALAANHPDPRYRFAAGIAATIASVGLIWLRLRFRNPANNPLSRRRSMWISIWSYILAICLGLWGLSTANGAWYNYRSHRIGPEFSGARAGEKKVYYGYCDVSIPPSHQVGRVEQPLIGAQKESRHVILERSELLEDQAFFATVREAIANCPAHDTFVFIHGYNVSFDQAARRTAQIHYDLNFQGVPIFFSWPSRADVKLYAGDRSEIGYSSEYIKQFLIDVIKRSAPGRIHVVAHSMGAEGAARAIAALGDQGKIIDQIILAAPDIDVDVFREQLAPRMVQACQRTTLYCSRNDWALLASRAFNDSPRVGDSGYGLVVRDDMDTIDASDIDTDLLGHSYYGDCLPILRDVRLLLQRNLRPEQRELQRAEMPGKLVYWLFRQQ